MALEQHAIPTEVTTYEFRLVGDMTLKQFAWLAGGIVIGILFFAAPIPPWFRWPLGIFFPLLGAAIAFVPVHGRTLDRWIIAFIKAIYAPTEFIWQKEKAMPAYMRKVKVHKVATDTAKLTSLEQSKLEEYIHSLPMVAASTLQDEKESQRLAQINDLLNPAPENTPSDQPEPSTYLNIPQTNSTGQLPNIPSQEGKILSIDTELEPTDMPTPNQQSLPPQDDLLEQLSQEVATQLNQDPTTQPATEQSADTSQTPGTTVAAPQMMEQPIQEVMASTSPSPNMPSPTQAVATSQPTAKPTSDQYQTLLPPPPSNSNILVGTVIDQNGQTIDNAIIEITNQKGDPVRALKSNKLGQFAIATPLRNDTYQVTIEKDNYQFAPQTIEANGKPLDPILIQSN